MEHVWESIDFVLESVEMESLQMENNVIQVFPVLFVAHLIVHLFPMDLFVEQVQLVVILQRLALEFQLSALQMTTSLVQTARMIVQDVDSVFREPFVTAALDIQDPLVPIPHVKSILIVEVVQQMMDVDGVVLPIDVYKVVHKLHLIVPANMPITIAHVEMDVSTELVRVDNALVIQDMDLPIVAILWTVKEQFSIQVSLENKWTSVESVEEMEPLASDVMEFPTPKFNTTDVEFVEAMDSHVIIDVISMDAVIV